MKKSIVLLIAAAVLPFMSSAEAAKIRIGLFVDNGAAGNGLYHLASMIEHSPQAELVLLMGQDIRDGKLKDIDVLVMPGGGSRKQCNAIGQEHLDKVRDFLRSGGGYIGTCAGMFNVLECRLKLLPFDRYAGAGGNTATVDVEITPAGAKILGIQPGIRQVRYSGGPVAYKIEKKDYSGNAVLLGTYQSVVSRKKEHADKFIGSAAWVYGTYGKGKIAVTSFHPEYWESTQDMMLGCFYAVSGVKLTPVFPQKNYRPVRVGMFSSYIKGPAPVRTMLELEKHPDIDLQYAMLTDLNKGILKHLDVLIVNTVKKAELKKSFFESFRQRQLTEFMDNGGVILAVGDASGLLPEHKNFVKLPENADVKKYILK